MLKTFFYRSESRPYNRNKLASLSFQQLRLIGGGEIAFLNDTFEKSEMLFKETKADFFRLTITSNHFNINDLIIYKRNI